MVCIEAVKLYNTPRKLFKGNRFLGRSVSKEKCLWQSSLNYFLYFGKQGAHWMVYFLKTITDAKV